MAVDEDHMDTSVHEIASAPLPEVPVTEGKQTVQDLLQTSPAVLLTATEGSPLAAVVGKYTGIVTAADFRPHSD